MLLWFLGLKCVLGRVFMGYFLIGFMIFVHVVAVWWPLFFGWKCVDSAVDLGVSLALERSR